MCFRGMTSDGSSCIAGPCCNSSGIPLSIFPFYASMIVQLGPAAMSSGILKAPSMAADDLLPLIAGRDVAAVADMVLRDFEAYAGQVGAPRAALATHFVHCALHGSCCSSPAINPGCGIFVPRCMMLTAVCRQSSFSHSCAA